MKTPAAVLLDTVARLEDDGGHVFFSPWRQWRSVFVELVEGAREGGSGGGERVRGTEVRLQGRLGGSGGARGDGSVVAVLGWLGGIPPSSLDARGRKTTEGGAAGPAGGPRPRRHVSLFSIFVSI